MKIKRLWFICLVLIIFSCKTQKQLPIQKQLARISTDKNDSRIEMLTGTWYSIPQSGEMRPSKFSKLPQDTTTLIYTFDKNGTLTLENKVNPKDTKKKWMWFLVKDKLYIESSISEKGRSNVYYIKQLSETELYIDYKGVKNVYEPFLCGDEYLYIITEVPPKYGYSPDDFENYFKTNLKLSEESKSVNTDFNVEFAINCNGEVCEVRALFRARTEFDKAIVELLKQMPKWTSAQQRGKPVNVRKKYKFIYENGILNIIKI